MSLKSLHVLAVTTVLKLMNEAGSALSILTSCLASDLGTRSKFLYHTGYGLSIVKNPEFKNLPPALTAQKSTGILVSANQQEKPNALNAAQSYRRCLLLCR